MAVDGGSEGHTKMELTYSEGYEAETTISREVVKQASDQNIMLPDYDQVVIIKASQSHAANIPSP